MSNGVEDLLADLDDLTEDESDESDVPAAKRAKVGADLGRMTTERAEDEDLAPSDACWPHSGTGTNVKKDDDRRKRRSHAYSPLLHSSDFQSTLQRISKFRPRPFEDSEGPIQEHPEYNLIVHANKLTHDIDTEVSEIHKVARDLYAPRFPELDPLVPNALDYARTVKAIGNRSDMRHLESLKGILPSATIMVVTVTAATTSGRKLSDEEWGKVEMACDMALQLDKHKKDIIDYIESRMKFIAPNFCEVVGSGVAARLMGAAGGIMALSKVPACNLPLLGAVKKSQTGLSSVSLQRHTGYLWASELVQSTPSDTRMKAQKLVTAKATLALRIDMARSARDGSEGRKLADSVRKRLAQILEPAPKQAARALPVPDEGPHRKRGGRRARAQKAAIAMSEARKQQNRMAFGVQEQESIIGDEAEGMGMLSFSQAKGSSSLDSGKRVFGKVRAASVNPKQVPKPSDRMKERLKAYASGPPVGSAGGGGLTSGLQSSLAFTPVQGLEFVNPEAQQQKLRDVNERWFSRSAGFAKVKAEDGIRGARGIEER